MSTTTTQKANPDDHIYWPYRSNFKERLDLICGGFQPHAVEVGRGAIVQLVEDVNGEHRKEIERLGKELEKARTNAYGWEVKARVRWNELGESEKQKQEDARTSCSRLPKVHHAGTTIRVTFPDNQLADFTFQTVSEQRWVAEMLTQAFAYAGQAGLGRVRRQLGEAERELEAVKAAKAQPVDLPVISARGNVVEIDFLDADGSIGDSWAIWVHKDDVSNAINALEWLVGKMASRVTVAGEKAKRALPKVFLRLQEDGVYLIHFYYPDDLNKNLRFAVHDVRDEWARKLSDAINAAISYAANLPGKDFP